MNYSFIPFGVCFEFRACLAGRYLCSQNIIKYSNKPAKGYERIIQRFQEDLPTLILSYTNQIILQVLSKLERKGCLKNFKFRYYFYLFPVFRIRYSMALLSFGSILVWRNEWPEGVGQAKDFFYDQYNIPFFWWFSDTF